MLLDGNKCLKDKREEGAPDFCFEVALKVFSTALLEVASSSKNPELVKLVLLSQKYVSDIGK